jgi:hypothetical protein
LVVACSGDQAPIARSDNEGPIFMGAFTPFEKVAYPLTTDMKVQLFRDPNQKTNMLITLASKEGAFINLEQLPTKEDLMNEIQIENGK